MSQWARPTFATLVPVGFAGQINAQSVNSRNLWFGGDEGIEVVWKTGENLAHPEDNPKVDPRMTTSFWHGSQENTSRGVVNYYLGHWHANPATLIPRSPRDSAPMFVRMMGGSAEIMPEAPAIHE